MAVRGNHFEGSLQCGISGFEIGDGHREGAGRPQGSENFELDFVEERAAR